MVKKSDDTAIFPNDTTGMSLFSVSAINDVYSSDGSGTSSTSSRMSSGPLGAYIGCTMCANNWLERKISCPLGRANDVSQRFSLKGFDDTTSWMRILDCSQPSPTSTTSPVETDSDDRSLKLSELHRVQVVEIEQT